MRLIDTLDNAVRTMDGAGHEATASLLAEARQEIVRLYAATKAAYVEGWHDGNGHVAMDGTSRVALRDWESSDAAKATATP